MRKFYQLGEGSQRVYDSGLHPDLRNIITRMLDASPMDFTLASGVRSEIQQLELYAVGRTYKRKGMPRSDPGAWEDNGKGVVTYCDGFKRKSNHQVQKDGFGHAIDIQAYIPGRPDMSYDKIHLAVLIGAFLTMSYYLFETEVISHYLRSGADWDQDTQYLEPGTFIDMPHLELIKS